MKLAIYKVTSLNSSLEIYKQVLDVFLLSSEHNIKCCWEKSWLKANLYFHFVDQIDIQTSKVLLVSDIHVATYEVLCQQISSLLYTCKV